MEQDQVIETLIRGVEAVSFSVFFEIAFMVLFPIISFYGVYLFLFHFNEFTDKLREEKEKELEAKKHHMRKKSRLRDEQYAKELAEEMEENARAS